MLQNKLFIIGITGAFGSGKSTASDFFETKGFEKIVLSSFLEQEAKKRGLPITRRILQDIGNQWREIYGNGFLAQKALEYLEQKNARRAVIDGIRNVGEIEEFKKNSNFTLVAINASTKLRFERLKQFKRREDLTWDLFLELDKRDSGVGEKDTGLHVAQCIKLADISIESKDNDYAKFYKELEKVKLNS